MPFYKATGARLAVISTKCGQRRILKQGIDPIEYMKKGTETGVYRTAEEIQQVIKERMDTAEDLRVVMRRFRQDIIRGSHIVDYPAEYLIWEQHPPDPEPLRLPSLAKKRLKQEKANDPVHKLTKQILEEENKSSEERKGPVTAEDYYRSLLGVQAAKDEMVYPKLRHKPAELQKAYLKAVKTYELQRSKNLSQKDALAEVDELLQKASKDETHQGRVTREKIRAWRKENPQYKVKKEPATKMLEIPAPEPQQKPPIEDRVKEHLSSIFSSDPHTLEGMMRWGSRLQAVPYEQWTIGASTALDHWIARRLLNYSEETWNELLEGVNTEHLDKGRHLVAVRELLFPETYVGPPRDDPIQVEDLAELEAMESKEKEDETTDTETKESDEMHTKSLDELLKSLGSSSSKKPDDKVTSSGEWSFLSEEPKDEPELLEEKIATLTMELQNWRHKNQEEKYDDWEDAEKEKFNKWMKSYVGTFANPNEKVDYDQTRLALLSSPPITEEESEEFWGSLSETEQVEAFLDRVREDGPPSGANILHAEFWNLPRDEQLRRLLNLGALRPILDEYAKESDRLRFLQRYGDALVHNVTMEHLVEDPEGPVKQSDLDRSMIANLRVDPGTRFSIIRKPFKSEGDMDADTKSRTLFRAWNMHKAGRARYEEHLFVKGKLGLRYSDKVEQSGHEDTDASPKK